MKGPYGLPPCCVYQFPFRSMAMTKDKGMKQWKTIEWCQLKHSKKGECRGNRTDAQSNCNLPNTYHTLQPHTGTLKQQQKSPLQTPNHAIIGKRGTNQHNLALQSIAALSSHCWHLREGRDQSQLPATLLLGASKQGRTKPVPQVSSLPFRHTVQLGAQSNHEGVGEDSGG